MPKLEINQAIFEGEGRAEIFTFRPENIEKERRGNLFFVGNIAKNLSQNDSTYYILNSLAAILKKEYYASTASQSSQAFEGALKKANLFLSKTDSRIKDLLELVTIALWDTHVMFSSFGDAEVILIREGRIFRLTKAITKKSHTFHHLTKGMIRTEDRIMIGTGQLSHWLGVPSVTSRILKHSWTRVQNHLYQERIEARDKKTLAILQIGIYAASSQPALTEEKELSGEEVEPSLLPRPAFQLRLPIMQEGYERTSIFNSLKLLGTHAWRVVHLLTSLRGWNPLPQRIVRGGRLPYQALMVKGALGIAFLLVLFLGMRSISAPPENNSTQNEKSIVQAQGATLMFTQLPSLLEPQWALFANEDLFVIAQNRLYQVHPDTKTLTPLLSIEGEIKGFLQRGNSLTVLTKPVPTRWEVLSYNPARKTTKKEPFSWPLEGDIVEETKEYIGNLYILELLEKEILRYDAGSLQTPVKWMSREVKELIENPLSFAIDGSIYLLDTPRILRELRSGLIIRTITLPQEIEANMVLTSPAMEHIYLIDKNDGHMAIIEKESAQVLASFPDDRFKGLLAITIDEARRAIKLINTHGVFEFNLPLILE